MAYDGNGNFNRLYNWQADAANGINIMADRMDAEMDGFAAGLSMAFLRDGQTTMSADADIGNNRLLRVADPTLDTDGVNKGWIDDNFLSSSGNTTISGDTPAIIFKETDQIADLNQWRMKVSNTSFEIEPLQSDGSGNNDFGEFKLNRDLNGLNEAVVNGGNLEVNVGDFRTDQDARITLIGYEDYKTTLRFKRQNPLGDATFTDVVSWKAIDAVPNNGSTAYESILSYGSSMFNVMEYTASSNGRHDFFCGTTNLDATINSNGFYMFGGDGLATTGKVRVGGSIDRTTLDVTPALEIGHGGSNAYISNMDVGNIDFRFGGAGVAENKVTITPSGSIEAVRSITAGSDVPNTGVYVNAYANGSNVTGFRVNDTGGNSRSALVRDSSNNLLVGNSNLPMTLRSSTSITSSANFNIIAGGQGVFFSTQSDGNQNSGYRIRSQDGSVSRNVLIRPAGGDYLQFGATSWARNEFITGSSGSQQFYCGTSNVDVRIDSARLRVYHNGSAVFDVNSGVANSTAIKDETTTNAANVRVATSGDGKLMRSTSSSKAKQNIRHVADEADTGATVDALRPRLFQSTATADDPNAQLAGFITEELAEDFPISVEAEQAEHGEAPQNYDERAIIALLTAELQNVRRRIEVLENP